ncbi:MAG TPA: hypothetical protein VEQ60_24335 [Longimicrobium sp.]|nr:hypothetical protein [Longimicrobium sp.]
MSFETLAIAGSIVSTCMCILAFILDRPSARAPRDRTITITIEDSSGARVRTVARSDRSVDEMKRLLDRLVTQPS